MFPQHSPEVISQEFHQENPTSPNQAVREKHDLHRGPDDSPEASGRVTSPQGHFPNLQSAGWPGGAGRRRLLAEARGFPWGPPHPSITLCDRRPRRSHPQAWTHGSPRAAARQTLLGALGRTSLAHTRGYQPACHDCRPCQALGSPTAPAEHNDTMPSPDPQFTLTPEFTLISGSP